MKQYETYMKMIRGEELLWTICPLFGKFTDDVSFPIGTQDEVIGWLYSRYDDVYQTMILWSWMYVPGGGCPPSGPFFHAKVKGVDITFMLDIYEPAGYLTYTE